ncbi:hypothetical protein D8M27_02765 [Corynebacterium pseudodiphtheriticum]|nr:hypothetical protein D8M37_04620 [Corynebacterium pseudodiphtheriticum]RUP97507.1 hypothetical protein D8M27_02765 [Corynebacterium pseudodiphtheriticum]RUQ00493.1 hypothetical protein D8M32_02770 [Corynebacterium pseudodiphtheriticum]RUQ48091.1 hypothetical protein D8M30_04025 [Corynebacterium pseudodiphtheriticum]
MISTFPGEHQQMLQETWPFQTTAERVPTSTNDRLDIILSDDKYLSLNHQAAPHQTEQHRLSRSGLADLAQPIWLSSQMT